MEKVQPQKAGLVGWIMVVSAMFSTHQVQGEDENVRQ